MDKPVVKKPTGGPPRRQQQPGRGWGDRRDGGREGDARGGPGGRGGAWGQQGGRGGAWGGQGGRGGAWGNRPPFWRDQPRQTYSSSVDIRPEWQVLGDVINLSALNKLSKQVRGRRRSGLGRRRRLFLRRP